MAGSLKPFMKQKCAVCENEINDRMPSPILGTCSACGVHIEAIAKKRGKPLDKVPYSRTYEPWETMIVDGVKIWHWRGKWRASHVDQYL